jgi:hypothetical protein
MQCCHPKQNFHLIQQFLRICNAWFTLLREEVFSDSRQQNVVVVHFMLRIPQRDFSESNNLRRLNTEVCFPSLMEFFIVLFFVVFKGRLMRNFFASIANTRANWCLEFFSVSKLYSAKIEKLLRWKFNFTG